MWRRRIVRFRLTHRRERVSHALARHYAEQSEKVTQVILLLAVSVLGIAKFGDTVTIVGYVLSVFVILLGVFGAVLVSKQSLNCAAQSESAKNCMLKLKEPPAILEVLENVTQKHIDRRTWMAIHCIVMLLGIVMVLCFYFGLVSRICG